MREFWRSRVLSIIIPYRALLIVVGVIAAAKLALAMALPGQPSSLGPDEGTYASLADAVARDEVWADWSRGWGAGLYPTTRAFLLPASLLIRLGVDSLDAVRIVAVLYAAAAQVALITIMWVIRRADARVGGTSGVRLASWPALGVAAFLLMPSHQVWSTIGLRESATEFWVVASALLIAVTVVRTQTWRVKVLLAAGLVGTVAAAFQSRLYLGVALTLASAAIVIWWRRRRPTISWPILVGVAAGAVLGVLLAAPLPRSSLPVPTEAELVQLRNEAQTAEALARQAEAEAGRLEPSASEAASAAADRAGQARQEAEGARAALEAAERRAARGGTDGGDNVPDAVIGALSPGTYLDAASGQRQASAEGANSAISVDSCSASATSTLSLRLCEIARLPGAALATLFRPLWPLDSPDEWSFMAVFASAENVLWIGLVAAALWVLVRRRTLQSRVLTIAVVYGTLVVAGLAALEGNLGTAFRHKSQVLWVLALVLMISGESRRNRGAPALAGVHRSADPGPDPTGGESPTRVRAR